MTTALTLPSDTLAAFGGDELRARVFHDKYALRDQNGAVLEHTPADMWHRLAQSAASMEPTDETRARYTEEFLWLLTDFRLVPGGRIMHALGNPRRVTAANCYVLAFRDDSIEAIFDWMKEAARTYSLGGGVGGDISVLRPAGAPVNNAARTSTGSVSFMELMSLTTGTIGQAGRRGALMITIADTHPDVLEFIKIKRNQDKVRFANISVRISDAFMQAVEAGQDWVLSFDNDKAHVRRVIEARRLWHELICGATHYAEPGLIFWDTMKRGSTSEYNGMHVITTNPCSEINLEPYGSCNLSNINLAEFVTDEFSETATIDWSSLERAARLTVRFLDNVLDYNMDRHPLPEQAESSRRTRRIGVGFTGLGDMLCKLQLRYDTEEAIQFADDLFARIKNIVYDESVNLAIEKGPFPNYNAEQHLKSTFVQSLDPTVLDRLRQHGLRNVALLTVPPVGSGALLAATTSGIEPIFDLSYTRRSESLTQSTFTVLHPLTKRYMERLGVTEEALPPYFVTAHEIDPEMRVRMQATIQQHIDHSISSTVNLPATATEAEVARVYFLAWKYGCKGITVYIENSRENILTTGTSSTTPPATATTTPPEAKTIAVLAGTPAVPHTKRARPKVTRGHTERIETPRGRIYVTVNEDATGLCEVFVQSLDVEADAVGRLASVALRTGADARDVIEQLWRVQSREVAIDRSDDGTVVRITTIAQGIALALGRFLYGPGFRPDRDFPLADRLPTPAGGNGMRDHALAPSPLGESADTQQPLLSFAGICPDCGTTLTYENGCAHCRTCGYSKCS